MFTYQAGTTTPVTVYSDLAQTTAHAFPIVADSAGYFAAMYLPIGSYKFVIRTPAGTTLSTADNVGTSGVADVLTGLGTFATRAAFVSAGSLGLTDGQIVTAGGLEYRRLASSTSISDLSGYVPNGVVQPGHFGAVTGSDAGTATANTTAVTAALTYLGTIGGGTLLFEPGQHLLTNGNAGSASWDNEVAVWVKSSNIHLRGAGVGATTLKLVASTGAHVIKFGQRVTSTVTVSNCSVADMTIDGNRANIPTPDATDDHWSGIDVATGCTKITLRDLEIKECAWYGIGFQREGHVGCLVENVSISNTGSDNIDCKNDDSSGYGNTIRGVRGSGMGLLGTSVIGTPAAGIDLRSGWSATDCVMTPGATTDIRCFRTQKDTDASEAAVPVYPNVLDNCRAYGTGASGTYGFQFNTPAGAGVNLLADDLIYGIRVNRLDCTFVNPVILDCYGGLTIDPSSGTAEGDTCTVMGGKIRRSSSYGVLIDSVDEISIIGLDVRTGLTGATGYQINSGSTNVRIIGGSCSGNDTQLTDNGTGTVIRNVSGLRTENTVTASVAIDSTGTKNFTVAHGLAVTPAPTDVDLQLRRQTNVGDWTPDILWVTGTTSTDILGQMIVNDASATGGATVDVVVRVRAKAIA
jgi:hypothetical protein